MKHKVIDHFRRVARNAPFQLSAEREDDRLF